MNFKNKKEESENRLNEVLTELNSLTSNISNILKCPFCDMKSNHRAKLSCHVKAYHCTDDMCQTDDIIVKHEHQSEKCQTMCKYNCFFCGYMINCQENLQKHKTECCEADSVISDLKCYDNRNRQTYSFPLPLPHVPSLSYPTPFSLPNQRNPGFLALIYQNFKNQLYYLNKSG